MSDLYSTTQSSETRGSRNKSPFEIVRHYIVILMSITFIWDIEDSHRIIGVNKLTVDKKYSELKSVRIVNSSIENK